MLNDESMFAKTLERNLIKKYRKSIWVKFTRAVKTYALIQEQDKIMVCISGGKDSFLLAKCIQELQRHGQIAFTAEYVVMDPGYREDNLASIQKNANQMNIPIRFFSTEIFDIVAGIEESPCYLCARMRRGHLYAKAQELGCNKIALGHHFDDVVETILMNMLYGGQIKTMLPKLHSKNFKGMELIRPLSFIKEEDIKHFWTFHGSEFLQCGCRFTECSPDEQKISKRREMKELVSHLRKLNPLMDQNIFHSMENIRLDTVVAYHKKGEFHHFLDEYDQRE
ncbi:PP-loop family protein [Clostridia bacterium]|nr:PP-loop family protein [Clostridia bacterium]